MHQAKVIGALPQTLAPNTQYFVRSGTGFQLHVTDSSPLPVLRSLETSFVCKLSGAYTTHPGNGWQYAPLNANSLEAFSDTSNFEHTGLDGQIRVLSQGIYQVSASVIVTNLPSATVKYILVAETSAGSYYLTRGFVELPDQNWWGASGLNTIQLSANDTIRYRLFLANNTGNSPLNANLNLIQLDLNVVKLK